MSKFKYLWLFTLASVLYCFPFASLAQQVDRSGDALMVRSEGSAITVNQKTGRLDFKFGNGVTIDNAIAYVRELSSGYLATTDCQLHQASTDTFSNAAGKGIRLTIRHSGNAARITLLQQLLIYTDHPYIFANLTAIKGDGTDEEMETREICALAVLPKEKALLVQPGAEPRLLDVPFDNDNWTHILERRWDPGKPAFNGITYEFSSVYDNNSFSGIVFGSLSHDFWKTGIAYHSGKTTGQVDSLSVTDGVATPDNSALRPEYGGNDGTHDHAVHGTAKGPSVHSSVIFLAAGDVRKIFIDYGNANALLNGRLDWKGAAPFYWNSFGVEGVLGYEGKMMPRDIPKISDFIATLDQFNKYSRPVMSIDSYDQGIYTTSLLASFGKYIDKKKQDLGFYFIPFAMWTWRNNTANTKIQGSDYNLSDALLSDDHGNPIWYKEGDWGCLAMDPTHPAVRQYVIYQLKKAKEIGAKFLKIDFLTAGALESTRRYNSSVRSGLQAYNYGMNMLKSLADSILGKDVFITEAISPMFPSQYAHGRFVSTDVYSHFRDDRPGFPHYGSTEASLASGSHLWWVQGTLWPYTNLDVAVMKNFQKNPDLTEKDIQVRLYAMMSMGSILGDGSDYRNKLAADRAAVYLNNKYLCAFFSAPKAFTPVKVADGESLDQQMAFFLPGKEVLISQFNFSNSAGYDQIWKKKELGLTNTSYLIKDFLTDQTVGKIESGQETFSTSVPAADARMLKLVPSN
ncbi:alpha-amylase family protein [Mucilaginibacter metallidurans]|uniref:hypothetical protein n=1 Tax=Mucilaginibacter sp. P4 TaxID=3383180 RepID=UPI001AD6B89B|nr:hypothetical protein [Mucilaginibacter gossypii]